jgi:hypothetical protein
LDGPGHDPGCEEIVLEEPLNDVEGNRRDRDLQRDGERDKGDDDSSHG